MRFTTTLLTCAVAAITTATAASANTMLASYYGDGDGFHGKQMANGQMFNQHDTANAAHKTLPFCTQVVVRGPNGNKLTVVIEDRGPYHGNRQLDVSTAAAKRLGIKHAGVGTLQVLKIIPPARKHRYGKPCDNYLG